MSDTRYVTIEVDGLPVEVHEALYRLDPDQVAESVRAARAEMRLPDSTPQAEDYDALVGDDS